MSRSRAFLGAGHWPFREGNCTGGELYRQRARELYRQRARELYRRGLVQAARTGIVQAGNCTGSGNYRIIPLAVNFNMFIGITSAMY